MPTIRAGALRILARGANVFARGANRGRPRHRSALFGGLRAWARRPRTPRGPDARLPRGGARPALEGAVERALVREAEQVPDLRERHVGLLQIEPRRRGAHLVGELVERGAELVQ